MEANICDVNHLDSDVLLPPRKRLLAGLKKQNSDADAASRLASLAGSSTDVNTRLNNLLSSHMNNPDLSPEEIAEVSKSAAVAAARAAEAARAAAEEKAAIAVKAVAAAKSALDVVASFSEEAGSKERSPKKNKLKKHVPVQLLYKKHRPIENNQMDEELAHKLHRAINSSPRISKNLSTSDWKSLENKKAKISPVCERSRISGGVVLESPRPMCNGHAVSGQVDSEVYNGERCTVKADGKVPGYDQGDGMLEMDDGEAETSNSKERSFEDVYVTGKKRGRVKLKKLPLSICTDRDRTNPPEELNVRETPLTEMNSGNPAAGGNVPLFTLNPADAVVPLEATSTWKCQDFKAPACVKQNKVVQS